MAARRGKKRAIIAVGHSILKSVYHILKNECEYHELGAAYVNEFYDKRRKSYLKSELGKMGYEVELNPKKTLT